MIDLPSKGAVQHRTLTICADRLRHGTSKKIPGRLRDGRRLPLDPGGLFEGLNFILSINKNYQFIDFLSAALDNSRLKQGG